MAHRLPTLDGWTVDCRLAEFRRVRWGKEPKMDSVPFDSAKGRKLIKRFGYKKFRRACA